MAACVASNFNCWFGLIDEDGGSRGRPRWGFIGKIDGVIGHGLQVKIVWGKNEAFAGGGVRAPGQGQNSVLVVTRAIALPTEVAVLEGVVVGDVGSRPRFKLRKFVGGVGSGAKESTEERLQVGLEWVEDNCAGVVAFMCSSRWRR